MFSGLRSDSMALSRVWLGFFLGVLSSLMEACELQQQLHGDGLHQEHCVPCGQRISRVILLPCWKARDTLTLPWLVHLLYDECVRDPQHLAESLRIKCVCLGTQVSCCGRCFTSIRYLRTGTVCLIKCPFTWPQVNFFPSNAYPPESQLLGLVWMLKLLNAGWTSDGRLMNYWTVLLLLSVHLSVCLCVCSDAACTDNQLNLFSVTNMTSFDLSAL